ncbi:MAG: IS21 family transposase, partial [Deltaproteobacteria bacterium]|nr:IS21 family transposase [Deltaproteobacteria bacterium]
INYRHVIDSLLRKPRAFRDYKYRSDMFPTEPFRWAYDVLCEALSAWVADMEYLRILSLAARTMETTVDSALRELRREGILPRWDAVLGLVPAFEPELPDLPVLKVDLGEYDHLFGQEVVT